MRYRYVSALAAFFLLWAAAWFCVNCEEAERYAAEKGAGAYLCGADFDSRADSDSDTDFDSNAASNSGSDSDTSAEGRSVIRCGEAQVMRRALGQTASPNPVLGVHTVTRGKGTDGGLNADGPAGTESSEAGGGRVVDGPAGAVFSDAGGDGRSCGAASELSGEDYETLLKIVEAEAGTEDGTGKLLVADVVLNRVESERFPDTVRQVVYQESGGMAQFSPAADGSIEKVAVSGETEEAVRRALGGEDVSGGALYFVSRKAADPENMRWFDENLTFLFSYGGHEFFR